MEKITLKLIDFYNLDSEINGLANQQSGETLIKGILREKLSLVTKYWLTELGKKVAAEKAIIDQLKDELIKKYGEEDDKGGISIAMFLEEPGVEGEEPKRVPNPQFKNFEKQFSDLLNTEKELEYKPISLDSLENVESADSYSTLFKLIKAE